MAFIIQVHAICEPRNPGGFICMGLVGSTTAGVRFKDGQYVEAAPTNTNNMGAYMAVREALQKAVEMKYPVVVIQGSAQTVMNQLRRGALVVPDNVADIVTEIHDLEKFIKVEYEYIPKAQNQEAVRIARYVYASVTGNQAPARAS
jgi:ribonuclease HI